LGVGVRASPQPTSLKNINGVKGSESTRGQFLRSADFYYKNFIKCPDLKIIFLLNKKELKKYQLYISKGFYDFLEGKAE